jgi:maleate cis-trans isomerase
MTGQSASDRARSASLQGGVLYPDDGCGSQREFIDFGRSTTPKMILAVGLTKTENNLSLSNLRETGSLEQLMGTARNLVANGARALAWACTSGSFTLGAAGAEKQVAGLAAIGVPATSTSLAYIDALRALNLHRVSVLALYPEEVTECFISFLAAYGVEVVMHRSLERATGVEIADVSSDEMATSALEVDRSDSDATLIPCTSIMSTEMLEPIQRQLGKPVLLANQVTIWRLAGLMGVVSQDPRLGALAGKRSPQPVMPRV